MDREVIPPQVEASATTTDLLVSYSGNHFTLAKNEILGLLQHFGDPEPWIERTSVRGLAAVHPALDNREVIRRCRALWQESPSVFRFAIKWVPVDWWCESRTEVMRDLIAREFTPRIGADERWAMRAHKRRWQGLTTLEMVRELATAVPRPVDLVRPDWIIQVDVVGRGTALSLLRPDELFAPLATR